jgi:hypothetical protein
MEMFLLQSHGISLSLASVKQREKKKLVSREPQASARGRARLRLAAKRNYAIFLSMVFFSNSDASPRTTASVTTYFALDSMSGSSN